MANFLAVAIAIFLDRLFGELPVYHPLKGFTRIATYLEDQWHHQEDIRKHTQQANRFEQADKSEQTNQFEQLNQPQQTGQFEPANQSPKAAASAQENQTSPDKKSVQADNQAIATSLKVKGALAAIILIIPFVTLTSMISDGLPTPLDFVFNVFILYVVIGAHSLKQHAFDVQNALISENLDMARKNLATIVNRDTKQMDRQDIIATCIESVVENGSEMILAPIFWFLVLGTPFVVLYGLVHALNNMWGYHSPHYKNFGWAVGRANDLLNWLPSRLAALSYILLGDIKNGWYCLNTQAKNWNSPNTELVAATGAGALNLEIGGDLYYQGQLKSRPKLGRGKLPDLSDIARTCDLVERSMVLWLACTLVSGIGH